MMDSIMTKAREAWKGLPEPDAKDPRWRNSPVELFASGGFEGFLPGADPSPEALGGAGSAGGAGDEAYLGVLRLVDGQLQGDGRFRGPGVSGDLLGRDQVEGLLEPFFSDEDLKDKHHARMWAASSPVLRLTVEAQARPAGKVLVDWVSRRGGSYAAPIILVSLGEASELELVVRWRSLDPGAGEAVFLSPAILVAQARDSRLRIFELAELSGSSRFVDYPLAILEEGADLGWRRGFFRTGLVKSRLLVHLEGRASRAQVDEAYVAGQEGHFDASILQDHRGQGTWSRTHYAGLADGNGRSATHGLIRIAKTAGGSDAYLSSKSLSLSPEARSVSLPELEIDTNDLTASHGSTVGNVGPEELYYLGTRGIDPAHAKALIAAGLLGNYFDNAPPELGLDGEALLDEVLGGQAKA